jgi:hypothetical protein
MEVNSSVTITDCKACLVLVVVLVVMMMMMMVMMSLLLLIKMRMIVEEYLDSVCYDICGFT